METDKKQLLLALKEKAQREASNSLAAFCRMQGFEPATHHKLIIDKLEQLEAGDIDRLMIFMPPGSAKSTYASVLFAAWFMGRNPTKNLVAASHTGELAARFGRRVRNIVGSADYHDIFDLGLSKDSTAADRWDNDQGGEYYACGVGGNVTGRRADLVLLDDPVRSREDADSETLRDKQWEWYLADLMTRLKPGGKIVLIMTRWHEDDIAGRILEREKDKWTILSLPMECEEDGDPLGRKVGDRLWPEWFTDAMLEAAKADERTWTSLYQQRPRPMEGAEFKREWLEWYEQVPRRKTLTTVMLVDPASGKNKTSDYTAIWVIGLGSDGNYYVVDIVRDRLNLTERAAAVFRLHKKWKPYEVRYERYGMMGDIEHIKDKMERESYRFRIVEVGGALKKEDRIRRLVPLFQQGRFWFPTEFWYTEASGRRIDLVQTFVEEELLAFPVAKHDDMMDGLSRIAQPDLELRWPKQDEYIYQVEDFTPMYSDMGY